MSGNDLIELVVAELAASAGFAGWTIDPAGSGIPWTSYRPPDGGSRPTGIKIHVSASLHSAPSVLVAVQAVLASAAVPFKHASSIDQLALLASGRLGETQIGKFMTVYPHDDDSALDLAWQLHRSTAGLNGPQIRYEAPLTDGSLVHLRYGAFDAVWLQLPSGRLTAGRWGEGGAELDDRADDPDRPPDDRLVGSRYVRVQRLHQNPKGSTWVGFAQGRPDSELLVIKEARAFVMETLDGEDACARLRHEARMLELLEDSGVTPQPVDFWEDRRRSFLVYRILEGPTLAHVIAALRGDRQRLPLALARRWTEQLGNVLGTIHSRGLVLGDLKPANVVITDDGFQLIDLELAGEPTTSPTPGIGSAGYASPQQSDPACGRSLSDDIFALGATMFSLTALVDAGEVPDTLRAAQFEAARRPDDTVLKVAVRCLADDPSERPKTTAAVIAALDDKSTAKSAPAPQQLSPELYTRLSRAVADRLVTSAVRSGTGCYWISDHPIVERQAARDLYAGAAGIALFLTEIGSVLGEGAYLGTARDAGEWLWREPPGYQVQVPMPGLFFGESGHGWCYLHLFAATQDELWRERAARVGDRVTAMPEHSPDLMTGDAGVVRFLLALHRSGAGGRFLSAARAVVERLRESATTPGYQWPIPDGHEGLSGLVYLGLSHGTAGIGLAAAEYAVEADDPAVRRWCAHVADWLVAQALPTAGGGLSWPVSPGAASPPATYWCHGSAGIIEFLAAVHQATGDAAYREAAIGAATAVASGSWWSGTSKCHGLAGNAEALIDAWQLTGDPRWLGAAADLAGNLMAYATDRGWPVELRDRYPPDLFVGQAGVGSALLRLAQPELRGLMSLPRSIRV